MKKILQAKVNVLIENNKILQEEREKQAQLKNKVKPQFSYSLYQQPSTIAQREESKHIRFQERRDEDLDSEESGYSEEIYQKRLAYIERRRGETLSMQELLKERHYFKKILENMHAKISKLASEALEKKLRESKKDKHSIAKIKHSNSVNIEQGQTTQYTNITKQSQRHKIVTNSELDASRLQLLNQQLEHLTRQKKKFQPILSQKQNTQSPISSIEGEKYKEIMQLKQTVKIRKAEIKKMKQSIFKMGKYLVASEENSPQKYMKIGNKENIKTEMEQQSSCVDLKIDIESKRNQLIEKKKRLEKLLDNIGETKDKIQNVNSLLQSIDVSHDKQTVYSFQQKQILTNMTDHLPPIDRNHSSMSIATISSFSGSIDEKYKYLTKKKQILIKSIRTEGQKWKNVYNEKMRKLINEYSNIKDIHRVALKLENEKTMKEDEYQWLVDDCRKREE